MKKNGLLRKFCLILLSVIGFTVYAQTSKTDYLQERVVLYYDFLTHFSQYGDNTEAGINSRKALTEMIIDGRGLIFDDLSYNLERKPADELNIDTYLMCVHGMKNYKRLFFTPQYFSFAYRPPFNIVSYQLNVSDNSSKKSLYSIDLEMYFKDNKITMIQRKQNSPRKVKEDLVFTVNGASFQMNYVKGGSFQMGCPSNMETDVDWFDDARPQHTVNISDYYIGQIEVTQGLWMAVMGRSISQIRQISNENGISLEDFGENNPYPMYYISWDDCQKFIKILNERLIGYLDGKHFDIPTEAQWEYAARGGIKSKNYIYSGSNDFNKVAWCNDFILHPTAQKQSNELGLYDMSGNVVEWCKDWYNQDFYKSKYAVTNPLCTNQTSKTRVLRGGTFANNEDACKVYARSCENPSEIESGLYPCIGLRLVLVP